MTKDTPEGVLAEAADTLSQEIDRLDEVIARLNDQLSASQAKRDILVVRRAAMTDATTLVITAQKATEAIVP